jgi:hypothetical protein
MPRRRAIALLLRPFLASALTCVTYFATVGGVRGLVLPCVPERFQL